MAPGSPTEAPGSAPAPCPGKAGAYQPPQGRRGRAGSPSMASAFSTLINRRRPFPSCRTCCPHVAPGSPTHSPGTSHPRAANARIASPSCTYSHAVSISQGPAGPRPGGALHHGP